MPTSQPGRNRLAQGGCSGGCGIICEPGATRGECIENERRSRVLRLTDRKADWTALGRRSDPREQLAQPLERVRLQKGELRVHLHVGNAALTGAKRRVQCGYLVRQVSSDALTKIIRDD